jgi:hypothetical protein
MSVRRIADGPYQARATLALALLCIPAWLRGDDLGRREQAEGVLDRWGGYGAQALADAYRPEGLPWR